MPLAGEFECLGLCLHGKCGVVCQIVFAITDISCCPDRPLVTAWHSYSQQAPHNLTLELVCTITAVPPAKVVWSREGGGEVEVERFRVEYHEDRENQDTVKHLLLIDNPTEEVRPGLNCGVTGNVFSLAGPPGILRLLG